MDYITIDEQLDFIVKKATVISLNSINGFEFTDETNSVTVKANMDFLLKIFERITSHNSHFPQEAIDNLFISMLGLIYLNLNIAPNDKKYDEKDLEIILASLILTQGIDIGGAPGVYTQNILNAYFTKKVTKRIISKVIDNIALKFHKNNVYRVKVLFNNGYSNVTDRWFELDLRSRLLNTVSMAYIYLVDNELLNLNTELNEDEKAKALESISKEIAIAKEVIYKGKVNTYELFR